MLFRRTSLNIPLTPALEQFTAQMVSLGRDRTASGVGRARLRRSEQTEALHGPAAATEPRSSTGAVEPA